jgi:hypothetical protein
VLRPSRAENSRLSSTRLVTDASGTEVENTDYLPFGEEIDVSLGDPRHNVAAYGSSGLLRHKFTGKERDTESGTIFLRATTQGRWVGSCHQMSLCWIKILQEPKAG